MNELKLILVDPRPELCDAWRERFSGLPSVEVVNDCFESLPAYDCMVSAANSFGLMDGGVDLAIIEFFGIELMDRVQERILTEYRGEQPVGTSFIIETGHARHPFLAHTPTMRVPMAISRTDNVYNAMWGCSSRFGITMEVRRSVSERWHVRVWARQRGKFRSTRPRYRCR